MRTARTLAASAALTLSAAAFAGSGSPMIYAVNHQGHFPDFGDTLIRFSADDPEGYETVGSLGVADTGFGGLAFDGDGNLWGYASFNSFGGAASGLYSIDTTTGEATVQGTLSLQTLTDLAWNPVEQTMYGVYTQGFATSRLYTVDLQTGEVTPAGELTGHLGEEHNLAGLAIDSNGTFYVYDNFNNRFFVVNDNLSVTVLYGPPETQCDQCEEAVGSQGIGIDWSRDDLGYHGAVGQDEFPYFYGRLNTFALDGSAYIWGPNFGPHLGDGPFFPPQVQAGDVAVMPAPPVPSDLTGDGVVNVFDLLELLANWGTDGPGADLDKPNDVVNVFDLLVLLADWGS